MKEKVKTWILNPLQVYKLNNIDISEGKVETGIDIDRKEALEEVRKSIKNVLNDTGLNVFNR
tara:strand:+ start:357 stop:542 length:186 start_codon:yes stop_codon:yes gene_type:complete